MLTLNINKLGSGMTNSDACEFMQNSLCMKRDPTNTDIYIQFLSYFGPAMTGMSFWNNNKIANQQMNYSPSRMKPSFTFASSTTVQPGWLKKRENKEIIL